VWIFICSAVERPVTEPYTLRSLPAVNTLLWKIAKPIALALALVFSWVVILALILMG
jgi:hypothetical protein